MSKAKNATRRSERALAFQVLYGLSFTPVTSLGALRAAFRQSPDNADRLAEQLAEYEAAVEAAQEAARNAGPGDEPLPAPERIDTAPTGFAWELVEGVWKNTVDLDAVITRFSRNWRVDRMGRIELTLLRLGIYELLYRTDIPSKVAINEALELARQFGEHNARSFVNGILDATARALETGDIARKG